MNRDPFAAIADPTRRAIIDLLSKEKKTVSQIADHFGQISRQAVSKQIKYLEESGLLIQEKNGREKYCYVELNNLEEVNLWLSQYESFWQNKLDRLGAYLNNQQQDSTA